MRLADAITLREMRLACTDGSARAARITARLTQKEIGDVCGVSPKTVALWETGKRNPGGRPALEYGRLLARLAA